MNTVTLATNDKKLFGRLAQHPLAHPSKRGDLVLFRYTKDTDNLPSFVARSMAANGMHVEVILTWMLYWQCWVGEIEAIAYPRLDHRNYGVDNAVIAIIDDFGTTVVLDTEENRDALEEAARLGLGKNGLNWSVDHMVGTVPAHKHVRVPA